MNYPAFLSLVITSIVIGYMFARADQRDMAVCQLDGHSYDVCFHTLNR